MERKKRSGCQITHNKTINNTSLEYRRTLSQPVYETSPLVPQTLKSVEALIMKMPGRQSMFLPEFSSIKILWSENNKNVSEKQTLFLGVMLDDSMRRDGICAEDVLIIDCLLVPSMGDIVVVNVNSHCIVGRLYWGQHFSYLIPSHPDKPFFILLAPDSYTLLGVATDVNHQLRKQEF